MTDLLASLKEVRPHGEVSTVGRHQVFRFRDVTPAHAYEVVLLKVGDRLVELTARDSYDEQLAAYLLDTVINVALPGLHALKIRVVAANFPSPWNFDDIVIVPPAIARRFDHESAPLRRITYWMVPAFGGEFANGDDGAAFWRRIRRNDGWRVMAIRWDRQRKIQRTFEA